MKTLFLTAVMSAAIVCGLNVRSTAVEIPLNGGVISPGGGTKGESKNSSAGIAYLDIEMIFNEHPMTARLKGEFEAEVAKRKKELSDMEGSIKYLQGVILSSTTEINKLKTEIDQVNNAIKEKNKPPQTILLPGTTTLFVVPAAVSTSTVKADPAIIDADEKTIKDKEAGIELIKADILKKQQEIVKKNKTNKEELIKLEDTNTKAVLSDIYKVIETLALEYNLTIVVDKNNVLYGQASQDLTDKLRDRMRGR